MFRSGSVRLVGTGQESDLFSFVSLLIDRLTGKQVGKQTDGRLGRQTGMQTDDRQTCRQTDWKADR